MIGRWNRQSRPAGCLIPSHLTQAVVGEGPVTLRGAGVVVVDEGD